ADYNARLSNKPLTPFLSPVSTSGTKLFSFSLVLAAAFLLLISLILSTLLTALAGRITIVFGLPEGVVQAFIIAANFILSALIFAATAAIFKFVPSVLMTWQAQMRVGVFTAILFAAGRLALTRYLGRGARPPLTEPRPLSCCCSYGFTIPC